MKQPIDPASLLPPGRSAERPCHECGELAYLTVSGEWRHMFYDPAHDASFRNPWTWDPFAPWASALATKLDHDLGGDNA